MTIVKRITEGVPVEKRGCMGLVAGTSVRTPAGARRIENLRPGDLIVTKDDGLCPVRVVFSRTVTAAEIAADPALAPIRLTPRAIAPMMPAKGLSVGGEHRLLIPGWRLEDQEDKALCLVPARELLGSHDAIYTERAERDVTYINLVFDTHQVFCADGLMVESFRPAEPALDDVEAAVKADIARIFAEGREAAVAPAHYPMPDRAVYRAEAV